MVGVPKYSSLRPVTPPDAKSASWESSSCASNGAKKSTAFSSPLGCTARCTIDSPRFVGGEVPGVGVDGAPPLPVAMKILPGPSDMSPAPDCQIPAPLPVASATQRTLTSAFVDTPNTQPCQGVSSQSEPKAA